MLPPSRMGFSWDELLSNAYVLLLRRRMAIFYIGCIGPWRRLLPPRPALEFLHGACSWCSRPSLSEESGTRPNFRCFMLSEVVFVMNYLALECF